MDVLTEQVIYTVCLATDTVAFYIAWIPPMCYAVLIMCVLATLIVK